MKKKTPNIQQQKKDKKDAEKVVAGEKDEEESPL